MSKIRLMVPVLLLFMVGCAKEKQATELPPCPPSDRYCNVPTLPVNGSSNSVLCVGADGQQKECPFTVGWRMAEVEKKCNADPNQTIRVDGLMVYCPDYITWETGRELWRRDIGEQSK